MTPKIFLKSPGGSGTKYLYSVFGKGALTGERIDFNPHQRFNDNLPKGSLVFYVMAHPLNILLSHSKSGFFRDQAMINNLQGDRNSWRHHQIQTLEDYANAGVNMIMFKDHFLQIKANNPDMIKLTYKNLEADMKKIPLEPIEKKPFLQRRSNYKEVDMEFIEKLIAIHKEDIDFYHEEFT